MSLVPLSERAATALRAVLAAPAGKRVGLYGLGISGRAMGAHLLRRGASLLAVDANAEAQVDDLRAGGAELHLGPVRADVFAEVELLVVSPGVDPRQPVVANALSRGVPVCGELELCGALPAKVAAITGTNGKSTTTALLGALAEGVGQRTFVGGNLGDPVIAWLDDAMPTDVAVLELSSFQLETAYTLACDAGIVLNVTPDHTDRYRDIDDYADTKCQLVRRVKPNGVAILSYDDPRVRAMAEACPGRVWWFSTQGPVPEGAYLDDDRMVFAGSLASRPSFSLVHPRLFGRHNRENALASLLGAVALGFADAPGLPAAYLGFAGLPHRLELVGEVDGVRWVNDSKATNDDATAVALAAVETPVLLLLGGRDKGGGYAKTRASLSRVREVIAFGEAEPVISAALAGACALSKEKNLRGAVSRAKTLARRGDTVLLAPACSSFDEFQNYKQRGDAFRAMVGELRQGKAS